MITMRSLHLFLAFCIALFCVLAVPSLAVVPAANSTAQTVVVSSAQQLEQQGKVLYESGQFEAARSKLQQAIQEYERQGDQLRQAIALSNLALVYEALGDWSNANLAIRSSLDLFAAGFSETIGSAAVKAQILDVQGRLQLAQGQAEQALESWQSAAQFYDRAADTEALTRNRVDQSRALKVLGLYRQAIALLDQALNLPVHAQSDDLTPELNSLSVSPTTAAALQSLGESLQAIGNLPQAQETLQRGLAIAQALKLDEVEAAILLDLGNTARAQPDTITALDYYQQVENSKGSATLRLRAMLNQLSLGIEQQQWSEAQRLVPQIQMQIDSLPLSQSAVYARINFARSLVNWLENDVQSLPLTRIEIARKLATVKQQAESLGDVRAVSYALGSLGELYQKTNQLDYAVDVTQQAIQLTQNDLQAPDIAYLWQWQLGQILKTKADLGINRQINTRGAIAAYKSAVQILQSLSYDLVSANPDQQFSFRETIEPVYRELIELLLQSNLSAKPSQNNLKDARTTLESLQVAELQNFFRQACKDAPVLLDDVVKTTISQTNSQSRAAVLYPIILPHQLAVILKLPEQSELLYYSTAIERDQVEHTLETLRSQLIQPDGSAQVPAKQIYDWLIDQAKTDFQRNQISTLVFVLDGYLKNIPMAALYDGNHYLIESYSIAVTPGLAVPEPYPLPADRSQISLLFAGVSQGNAEFSALPSVEIEQEGIAEVLQAAGASDVVILKNFNAEDLEQRIEKSTFQVVHLATHGKFSADQDKTFIVASNREIKVAELDQILRTRDQTRTDPLELLVLSACETAQGDEQAALGLAGVAVRAGARSTLASLWSLDDQSGARLMIEFYKWLMNNPTMPKAEALRQAQLSFLEHPNLKRPAYWAPYVLLGNWL